MLQLSLEQHELLLKVARSRMVRRIAGHLALQWPQMAERLGPRLIEFVDVAVQRAQRHGLFDGLIVARYVNLWFVFGSSFEDRPAGAWAAAILGDGSRPERAKAHQLSLRGRDELARAAPGAGPAPGQLAFSEQRLAAELWDLGRLGDLAPATPPQFDQACDLAAVEIASVDVAWRQVYSCEQGQWLRQAVSLTTNRVRVDGAGQSLPAVLAVLARPAGESSAARLSVRIGTQACCDEAVHPRLTLASAQSTIEWRGREAMAVTLPFACDAGAAARPDAITPPLAAEVTPQRQVLQIQTCAVRDSGPAVGDLRCELAIVPAEQWLLAWRAEPFAPCLLSADGASPALPAPAAPVVRLERDGAAADATPWRDALMRLRSGLQESWPRLLVAFEREARTTGSSLHADGSLLSGEAGLAWGWREEASSLAGLPFMHIELFTRAVACALDLRLEGDLDLNGARSRITLAAKGEMPLALQRVRDSAAQAVGEWAAGACVSFQFPFTLEVEPMASASGALAQSAAPVTGAVVGACGLRPVNGASGLQWFATLRIEPVSSRLQVIDPVMGSEEHALPLLPEMSLLDWSMG